MLDRFGTLLAGLIANRLARPRPLAIDACVWLAAEADALEEKRRCLNAIPNLPEARHKSTGLWGLARSP